MFLLLLLLGTLMLSFSSAQTTTNIIPGASTIETPSVSLPAGSYESPSSQITVYSSYSTATASANSSSSASTTTTANSLVLVGSTHSTRVSGNATSTSTAASATNTQPCNNYPEFCTRKYSNITEVCSHNSAFVKANNAFSNQDISIAGQLNDGIRMSELTEHLRALARC